MILQFIDLHRDSLQCGPGCINCCQSFSLLPMEASLILQQLRNTDQYIIKDLYLKAGQKEESCPLLANDLCTIYPHRPIICRTHGLPLGYVDPDQKTIEVSACTVNFSKEHPFEASDLFFMDKINATLQQLNIQYATLKSIDPLSRISIKDLLGRAYGK